MGGDVVRCRGIINSVDRLESRPLGRRDVDRVQRELDRNKGSIRLSLGDKAVDLTSKVGKSPFLNGTNRD